MCVCVSMCAKMYLIIKLEFYVLDYKFQENGFWLFFCVRMLWPTVLLAFAYMMRTIKTFLDLLRTNVYIDNTTQDHERVIYMCRRWTVRKQVVMSLCLKWLGNSCAGMGFRFTSAMYRNLKSSNRSKWTQAHCCIKVLQHRDNSMAFCIEIEFNNNNNAMGHQ